MDLIDCLLRWMLLPNMPSGRHACGAVHIPALGDLVLGGVDELWEISHAAELLQTEKVGNIYIQSWKKIDPMVKARRFPSAVYFDKSVFVTSRLDDDVEILSLPGGQPGQWSIVHICSKPIQRPLAMGVHNGRILLSGKN